MYSDLDDVFYKCDKCQSNIGYGNFVWIVSRSEGTYVEKSRFIPINTFGDDYVLVLCAQCGCNSFDFEYLRNALKSHANIPSRHKLRLEKTGYCDACGVILEDYDDRVTVDCTTGDMEYNSSADMGDLFVRDTEVIWTCCQSCGSNFDIETLIEIFSERMIRSPFKKTMHADCGCSYNNQF